jgi:hypothetical protein
VKRQKWAQIKAVPQLKSSQRVLQVRLYAVIGVLLLAAAAGPLSLLLSASRSAPQLPATPDAAATGIAEVVAREFLAGGGTSVPVAKDLDPRLGRVDIEFSGVAVDQLVHLGAELGRIEDARAPQSFQMDRFLAVTVDGTAVVVTVTTTPGPFGPVLAAAPSLQPFETPRRSVEGLDYRQVRSRDSLPTPVRRTIVDWAEAFTSGSPEVSRQLRQLAGDPDVAREYRGLAGFRLEREPQILAVVPGGEDGTTLYVRIGLWLAPNGADGVVVNAEYDLRVEEALQANPNVVAWGPPGSAAAGQLTPYVNGTTR